MKLLSFTKQTLVLWAVTLGSSIAILDGSIVNLALPAIEKDLQVGFSTLQWITDAYLLSLSALILLGGSLGDIFGRKKVYLVGVVGFASMSLLCAIAPNAELLILARALQGVFGALMVPGALSIINTTFITTQRGRAIGQWTAWSGIAVVAAPFIAGALLDTGGWRWIFLINIPLAVICFYLGFIAIKETKDMRRRHIDAIGAVLVTLALGGITYGLIEGPIQQWSLTVLGVLALALVCGLLFVLRERKTHDPMVPFSLFASRDFLGANVMTFLMYGALGGFTFVLSIHLQTALHYTPFQAGLSLLPVSIFLLAFSGKVGALATKYGPRFFLTVGPIIAAVGIALFYFIHPDSSYITGILPGILLFSVGLTLLVAPLTTTVMLSVEDKASGTASGVNNALSRAAGLVVIALLGLFGADQVYPFAIVLCAVLALLGGIVSFVLIQKQPRPATMENARK